MLGTSKVLVFQSTCSLLYLKISLLRSNLLNAWVLLIKAPADIPLMNYLLKDGIHLSKPHCNSNFLHRTLHFLFHLYMNSAAFVCAKMNQSN